MTSEDESGVRRLTPREQLIDRMRTRFEHAGHAPDTAIARAVSAVDNFYAETRDEYHEAVSYEAVQVMLEVMPPFVTHFRSAFEHLASYYQNAAREVNDVLAMVDLARAGTPVKGVPWQFDASGFPAEDGPHDVLHLVPDGELTLVTPPEDRISGFPYHYVLNGDHSQCACGGHSITCQSWDTDPHAPSLCRITRTNCNHLPRCTYGQLCTDDLPPAGADETNEGPQRWARGDLRCLFHGKVYPSHDHYYGNECRRCGLPKSKLEEATE